ncbi:cobyric acid synthase [Paenibacillus humicola]|uniref:cobyric acid synthase n=1 Tax=Paenibacillus humicola TaxID=3110540 RepID=UPI00237AFED8|nr:cobyric acid synthase [Paenibacillus humicola]
MKENRKAKTVMLQGTASDVGKSVLTAALCRIFTEDGYRTAPFKSQNMSNNSYVTWDGREIGRAQGMQADACGILATTDMNPVLLKPKKDMIAQVVIHGRPLGDYEARAYREQLLAEAEPIVRGSLDRLRNACDVVVLEGAGSPAEINLKDRDIVNMRAAAWAEAPVVLVADIDRGGMFAAIVGTLELLEPEERGRVCGFIVNKFRGDVSLLQPGLDWLERKTGKPVLGVVPYLHGIALEDEDSLSLDTSLAGAGTSPAPGEDRQLDIAVLRLPHISNFTDIDPLHSEPDVRIRYVSDVSQWGTPDAVIVPGSKNAVDDLLYLRTSGLAERLKRHAAAGGHTAGICGGYEMMGVRLLDPLHAESDRDETEGLGWFPFEVVFAAEKRTRRVEGIAALPGLPAGEYTVEGYEIHMGAVVWRPEGGEDVRHPFRLRDSQADAVAIAGPSPGNRDNGNAVQSADIRETEDHPLPAGRDEQGGAWGETFAEGCASQDGRIWGTFMHGVLHNDGFRRAWLNRLRAERGLEPLADGVRFKLRREEAFARLAEHVRAFVDMDRLKALIGLQDERRK